MRRTARLAAAFCCLMIAAMALPGTGAKAFTHEGEAYVLDESGKKEIPIPQPYIPAGTIGNIGGDIPFLNNPQDLFITREGALYVCDTGNNRVVRLEGGKIAAEYTGAGDLDFQDPSGIFLDDYGHLYIADTGNARVVHLNAQGEFVESFVRPESDLLYDTDQFEPNKVAVGDSTGSIYILQGKHFMTIDAHNQFKGYIGANRVGFDLRNFLYRLFASDEQKKQVGKKEPSPYNNFHLSADGLLYAVASGNSDQIRVVNSVGNNIYPVGFYGEMTYDEQGKAVYPLFSDIAVDEEGIVTVAEQNSAKLYQYDGEGNLLAVFGGKGTLAGQFDVISSLAVDAAGRLYVLDSSRNNIQILEPTRLIRVVQEANELYLQGSYDASRSKWEEVMSISSNYPLARISIGKIQHKQKDYAGAMANFFAANDREDYGLAFEKSRYLILRQYFGWIVAGLAVAVTLLVWVLLHLRKRALQYENDLYDMEREGPKGRRT